MPDSLEQLLRRTDANAPAPPLNPAALAADVRTLARRRRTRRTAGLTALAVASLALLSLLLLPHTPAPVATIPAPEAPLTAPQLAALMNEIQSLRSEAENREQIVALMLKAEKRPEHSSPQSVLHDFPLDPADEILLQRDRTASIMVHSAERLARTAASPESAIEEYKRIVQLFPQTHSAEQARRRLDELAG